MGKYRYNIDGEFSTRRQWHAQNRRKNKRENSIKKLFIIFLLFLILLAAVFCVILFVVRKNEKEDVSRIMLLTDEDKEKNAENLKKARKNDEKTEPW